VSRTRLAVDVATAALDTHHSDRFVSRSRSQVVYQAARSDVEQRPRTLQGDEEDEDEQDAFAMDWDALYDDGCDRYDQFDDLIPERERDLELVGVERHPVTSYRSGRQVSGMIFSPGRRRAHGALRQSPPRQTQR
jgi:hypothetical protein